MTLLSEPPMSPDKKFIADGPTTPLAKPGGGHAKRLPAGIPPMASINGPNSAAIAQELKAFPAACLAATKLRLFLSESGHPCSRSLSNGVRYLKILRNRSTLSKSSTLKTNKYQLRVVKVGHLSKKIGHP